MVRAFIKIQKHLKQSTEDFISNIYNYEQMMENYKYFVLSYSMDPVLTLS